MTWFVPALCAAVFLSLAMAAAWMVARREGGSGWTDAIWSFATGAAGVAVVLWPAEGASTGRQWLVAALIGYWGGRLGGHIASRTLLHAGDDPRYAELRREWASDFDRRLFRFLQIQALAGWVLAMSAMVAARNPAPFPSWGDAAGLVLAVLALIGESVADAQLRAFRRDPMNRGGVCDVGLWSVSRHPNYFFEWLFWLALAMFAIGPFGWNWLALAAPAMMYWLLVHVSGIPPLEAHMLRSRGDEYRDVQRRIRPFWPIPGPPSLNGRARPGVRPG
ncbi:DUF1295 domain-containing protein [Alsobacter sp. SYSU M60028]|uniref:DUF1295 domain-containing protein n=1 Tax=Alsobacter ponti TaxID=2962936 RepID=A0ABT1LE86_9HYPH|nr:DUF1295 domain-containing protein [Alsobacter ponti]MCP8939431.1 DUF1295 domain-containing protein [Alsobacter ponti]